jgi:NADH-quinone oxidoreductase subunit N
VNFPEFYPLILFASLGMMFMTSGSDLIVIFIGLEILSLSLYILVGLARNTATALEATMKYFLLGSFQLRFYANGHSVSIWRMWFYRFGSCT